jgi:hypothetical protein
MAGAAGDVTGESAGDGAENDGVVGIDDDAVVAVGVAKGLVWEGGVDERTVSNGLVLTLAAIAAAAAEAALTAAVAVAAATAAVGVADVGLQCLDPIIYGVIR